MGEIHLDTDVLIDLIERYDLEYIERLMVRHELKISSIVYYEFCIGVYRVGKIYLKNIIENYLEIIPFSGDIADKAAEIQAQLMREGKPMDHRDIIIGVTAIMNNAELWTKNLKHFERLREYGLKVYRPKTK